MVAWYALDLLDPVEQDQFEVELVHKEWLEGDLNQITETLACLSYLATPVTPAPDLKARLQRRLEAEANPPTKVLQRASDRQWQSHPVAGVKVAQLHVDTEKREMVALMQGDPEAYYPVHRHVGPEEIYMLEGDLIIYDTVLTAGDYIRSVPDSQHPHRTLGGCICLVHACYQDQFLEPLEPVPLTQAERTTPISGSQLVRSADLQWYPHLAEGITIALFHQDPVAREVVGLLRAEAGSQYPCHRHAQTEEIYMLSGDLILEDGTVLEAGDYLRSDPGSAHAPITESGCLFFFHASLDDYVVAGES
ncbi:MAG: cupin domain-containing protein [Synechococcaceae cyanobacterium SM2_3_1]|nr:cupin domain-containing protein [Synechococcaceae cyanobacterium SM2_3_1]